MVCNIEHHLVIGVYTFYGISAEGFFGPLSNQVINILFALFNQVINNSFYFFEKFLMLRIKYGASYSLTMQSHIPSLLLFNLLSFLCTF